MYDLHLAEFHRGCRRPPRVYYQGHTSRSRPCVEDQLTPACQVSASCISVARLMHLSISRFPKTYPRLACATFSIEKPINGISDSRIVQLSHQINSDAQKLRGTEMVFTVCSPLLSVISILNNSTRQIVTIAQDWISNNIVPPREVAGSLAFQMSQRATDEERVRVLHYPSKESTQFS